MATGVIFPTSIYGQLSDVYGTAVSQYANSNGFPLNSGLQLGSFGLLFDATIVRLLNAVGSVQQYGAVTFQSGNGNDYNVQQTTGVQQYVVAVNDRSGGSLSANNIAWFTESGSGTSLVGASLSAGTTLVSSTTPGQLAAYSPGQSNISTGVITGQSVQTNIQLLNATTTAGAYPVRIG